MASAVLLILVLAIGAAMRVAQMSLVKSRQQMRASRLTRTIHTQIQSMNFFEIFTCDSSLPDFGLTAIGAGGLHAANFPFTNFPSSRTLIAIQDQVTQSGFDHFELRVSFMRRDRSAVRTPGVTSNVIPFTDTVIAFAPPAALAAYTTGDGIDDYDINIKYDDINSDGDYYDTYFRIFTNAAQMPVPAGCLFINSGPGWWLYFCDSPTAIPGWGPARIGRRVSEMPDTRFKQVDFRLWNRKKEIVHKEGWLISETGYGGNETDDWESELTLAVSQPVFPTMLYAATTLVQTVSRALPITKAYPASLPRLRADAAQPLVITGNTNPLADVSFTTSPTWSAFTAMDGQVNIAPPGTFSFPAPNITAALVEGKNRIGGIAVKGSFLSPLWYDDFIYDRRPPIFQNPNPPTGTNPVKTLTPFVGLQFLDDTAGTPDVSGIAKEVLWVGTGANAGAALADAASLVYGSDWPPYAGGWLVVASTVSGLIDPLPDNDWVFVHAEGGDKAGYKNRFPLLGVWKFKVKIDNLDATGPTVKKPSNPLVDGCDVVLGPPTVISCRLDDPDSGVDWRTIDLKLYLNVINPANIVDKVNPVDTPRMADYFDPKTIMTGGILTYRPMVLVSGNVYWVELQVRNHLGVVNAPPVQFNFIAP